MPTRQNFELVKLIAGLLQSELQLPAKPPRVFIYNQKWRLPTFEGMFLEVGYLGYRVFGSKLAYAPSDDQKTLMEFKSCNVQEWLGIKVWSANGEARQRNHEIVLALHSNASQQLQEQYCFKLANIPESFIDISDTEASARLNTYALRFNALRKYDTSQSVPFYDSFPQSSKPLLVNP